MRLCETADVFVHNVRPAGMRRARLGENDLRAVNPRLIYVSLVGYGQGGPYAPLPAYDDLFQGRVGIASLIGSVNGIDPRFVPVTIVDRIVGLNAVHTMLAALYQRERTGKGQAVELPMLETMAQFVLGDHMGGRGYEPPIGPPGYSRLTTSERRPYRTRDGFICTLVYTDNQWRAFFRAIGKSDEEFAADARVQTAASRAQYFGELYAFVAEELTKKSTAEWLDLLQRHDIPVGPLNDLDGLIDDEHLAGVGFFHAMQHPTEGAVRMVGIPSRWSDASPSIRRHTPNLGEHTDDVLNEAGFARAEVDALMASGAAVQFGATKPKRAEG
jgi:crotonobetainyl-CoA:carnitine CoA-transferase CaiB-like acyl-CoA transferase